MTLSLLARSSLLSRLPLVALVPLVPVAAMVFASNGGCTQTSTEGSIPPGIGLTCSSTANASDSASAKSTLAAASAGTCVVLPAGTYEGPFTIPAGVSLVAQNGQRATITGGTAQSPAVSMGEGSQLANFDLVNPGGVGIAMRSANGLLVGNSVSGAKNAAVAILCKESATPGCAAGVVTIVDTNLTASALGLWISGAHISMTGGSSSSHAGTGLTAAAGIIAQDGAKLELENVTVEKNEGVGILIDGAATTAGVKNITVNENGERGIWAQGIAGTLDAPALKIEASNITKNKIVGVGATQSHGIIIVGGRVADSVASPVVTNLSSTESVGDGVGLFAGSGDLKLDGAEISSNARAAGIFDGSDRGIIIVGGVVGASEMGFKFVVQNSKGAMVQIDDSNLSAPPKPLGVSAPHLGLPAVL